jgi:outer membrane beta-barrel protein
MKIIFFILALTSVANAADLMKDFDSLGGNKQLLEKARKLNPSIKSELVQNRVVNRETRWEFSPETTSVVGGDAYTKTWMLGLNVNFHKSNKWSYGFKYARASNSMSAEGDNLIQSSNPVYGPRGEVISYAANIPAIDYIKEEKMLMANWYPIYGKFNFADMGIVHFDIYALGGAGTITLASDTMPTYAAGGGIGFWFSQHLTSRFEIRYQGYKAHRFPDREDQMDLTTASFQLGYLL